MITAGRLVNRSAESYRIDTMPIEQAIVVCDAAGPRVRAHSPGFRDDWQKEAERICRLFGERPDGLAGAAAVFAQPIGPHQVAVVQAADAGRDLALRFLILPRQLYADLESDPFRIAEQLPPRWSDVGELPPLDWPSGPPAPRTIADLRQVLDVPYSATLLGGAQALLDGGRLAFERTEPAPKLVRGLWSLLPSSTRAELWPSTFAFGNALRFDIAVVPRVDGPDFEGYVLEEQAGDYPEGRYELALQVAVESEDQAELNALLSRRSRSQTMRLGLMILAALVIGPVLAVLFVPPGPPRRAPRQAPPQAPPAKPVENPR